MQDDEIIVEELELESDEEGKLKQVPGPEASQAASRSPDYRIVQGDVDKDGKKILRNVGGIWIRRSRAGQEFFSISIGNLRLLAFKNDLNKKVEQTQL